jgi:hypothetical protein
VTRALAVWWLGSALFALGGGAAAQVPPKAPGVVRIGIVLPRVEAHASDSLGAAQTVRDAFAAYLRGPTIEVVPLAARLPSQYAVEAANAQVDVVLATSVAHRRSRLSGAFGRALGNLATQAPRLPGDDSASAAILTGVLGSVADFASSVQARDELELEYRLEALGAAEPLLDGTVKRRATADGEDVLTPLIAQASEAIGAALARDAP